MTTLSVGTNDAADKTGDLIVTFVDLIGTLGVTTDGTRIALPGAAWGTYLIAPSISPQAGCTVTFTPAGALWESCSLVWAPPPYVGTLWTSGGAVSGYGGLDANPKWPPTGWDETGEIDGAASTSGQASWIAGAAGKVDGVGSISGRALVRAAEGAVAAATPGIAGRGTGAGVTIWPVSGAIDAAARTDGRARLRAAVGSTIGGAAAMQGDAQILSHNLYDLGTASINAAAGISGNCRIGHQYFVVGPSNAISGVIPFGGNAPLRVSNYITDPRPEAVLSGSPGTIGQWDQWSDDLTRTVVGTGYESQIPYIDLRFSNPASGGGTCTIQFEQNLYIGAGIIWSMGVFARVLSGASNISYCQLVLSSFGAAAWLNSYYSSAFSPTNAGLASQWFHLDGAYINDAGMDQLSPTMDILYNAGAVDFTIRLGGVRLEETAAAHGPQYIVVPGIGFVPAPGTPTTYVY